MQPRSRSKLALAHTVCAIALCVLSSAARPHGGAYNPVPPTSQPVSAAPTGPGPTSGGPGPATALPPPGSSPATDAAANRASWEDWWHFNKDPYLDLRRAIGAGAPATGADEIVSGKREERLPSHDLVRSRILPALRGLLEAESANEVVGSAMIALARAGEPPGLETGPEGASLTIPLLVARLPEENQELAETAALALGILQREEALPILAALLEGGKRGRELVGGHEVPDRTRAFAAYGLGLVAHRAANNRARQLAARALCEALQSRRAAIPDVEVAAVIALSIDRLELERNQSSSAPWISRQTQIRLLRDVFEDRKRRTLVRAHAVTAIARLAQDAPGELRGEIVEEILAAVRARSKLENEVLQSCAQALGYLGDADADQLDRRVRTALGSLLDDADVQTRSFALIALAEIGSREGEGDGEDEGSTGCRNLISGEIVRGRGITRPWAAIALGVLERRILDRTSGSAGGVRQVSLAAGDEGGLAPSRASREILRRYFAGARQRTHIGAGALALGLCRDSQAAPLLLDQLRKTSEDQGQGYVALALGMIGATEAVPPLKDLVRTAKYKPALLEQVATALALLGDKPTAAEMADLLARAQGQFSQVSYANALGRIGDDRAVGPLLQMLTRKDLTSSARGFAAAALGQVADKDLLPWFSPIATDLNYQARTATLLAGDGTGLLEIL